jgi:hypothetical protein
VLVLTKAEFVQALQRGNAYRRQALAQQQAPQGMDDAQ